METVLAVLRAAGEQTRLRLLALCARGDLTVTDLCRIVGQSQPRISRHLKVLCDSGLLERRREGSFAFYRLAQGNKSGDLGQHLVSMIPEGDAQALSDRSRMEQVQTERAERAAAYFRDNASQWDAIRSLHIDEEEVERLLLDRLGSEKIGDLVDIGTGTGRLLVLLGDRVERGVGIDLSREMLAIARAALEKSGQEQCRVRLGDMYALPLADASADVVTIHQVLHYADRPAAVLSEAIRILKPGGRLFVIDFAPHDLETLREVHNHQHLGFSSSDIATWCAKAGGDVVESVDLPGKPLTVTLWRAVKAVMPPSSVPQIQSVGDTP